MTREKNLFEERQFTGSLGIDDKETPITFKARLSDAGEVLLDLEEIPLTERSAFIVNAWHDRTKGLALFRLSGVSADDVTLQTEHLRFNSVGPHSSSLRGSYYVFNAHPTHVTLRRPSHVPRDQPILTLWVRGFRCFPRVSASSELGKVVAQGDVQNKEAGILAGYLSVHSQEVPADQQKWCQQAEQLLDHVRRVMSFAEGTDLRDPVLEYRSGSKIEIEVHARDVQYDTAGYTFHPLDRQAIFDAAVRSFFHPPYPAENLWMALDWFAMTARYEEARLILAMTALENLVSSNTKDVANLLDDSSFNALASAMQPVIDQFVSARGLEDKEKKDLADQLTGKLKELQRRSLKRRLKDLMERWSVPRQGINARMIDGAITARNRIVHEGRYYDDPKRQVRLREHVGVVREIVTRIIFRAVGFEGRYTSHLGGYHEATFPPP